MVRFIVTLVFVLLAAAGIVWLQFFLSGKAGRWPGLILPVLSFLLSWLFVLNIMDTGSLWQNAIVFVSTFFIANIPTVILLAVYFACRERRRRKAQIERMNIQDLE